MDRCGEFDAERGSEFLLLSLLSYKDEGSEFTWPAAAKLTNHTNVQRIITSSRDLHLSQLWPRLHDDGLTLFKLETNKSAALLSLQMKEESHQDVSVSGDAVKNIILWQDEWGSGEGIHHHQVVPQTVQKLTDALIGKHVQILQGLHLAMWRLYWATFVH